MCLRAEDSKLEERREDIPCLINHFMENSKIPINMITNKAVNMLKEARWPGNVRQLSNIMERLIIMNRDGIIDSEMVKNALEHCNSMETHNMPTYSSENKENNEKLTEEELIKKALIEAKGNRKKTADILGISTTTLWRRIGEYDSIDEEFLERVKYGKIFL